MLFSLGNRKRKSETRKHKIVELNRESTILNGIHKSMVENVDTRYASSIVVRLRSKGLPAGAPNEFEKLFGEI